MIARARGFLLASATVFLTSTASGAQRAPAPPVRPLAYTKLTLPNGLVALLNEDHSAPVVAVQVWYHLGAKDEHPGHTGLAHLCEHLMGEGTPHEPESVKSFVQSLGGTSEHFGETDEDRMVFDATVPPNELETMLWLESDRMAVPLAKADSAHVALDREVVRQERVQRVETAPFQLVPEIVTAHLLGLPYRAALGPMTDLESATAADARAFCTPYFVPANAVLSLSGDFSTPAVERLIRRYFGPIPYRPAPSQPVVPDVPAITTTTRLVLEDAHARVPMLVLAWRGAAYANPDRQALLAFASALGRDRTGRLSKLLKYDRGLASTVQVDMIDLEESGVFQVLAIPRPNASLTEIERLADSVVADALANGISDADLEPFKRARPVETITSLQTRSARADTLAHDQLYAHNPVAYVAQLGEALALTPNDVLAVARRYLDAPHLVLSVVPAGKLALVSQPDAPYTNVTPSLAASKVTP